MEAEQTEHYVVDQRLFRKQREDLIGARKPEMHALLRWQPEQFLPEQFHRSRVRRKIAGNQIKQRGLAGAVRADDQPPLTRHYRERNLPGRRQAAEALVQIVTSSPGVMGRA